MGIKPSEIGARLGCATQTFRGALRAFTAEGTACLREKSQRLRSARPTLDDASAEVASAVRISPHRMSGESIRRALKRLGVGWKRAKTWITNPDPAYLRKKGCATD